MQNLLITLGLLTVLLTSACEIDLRPLRDPQSVYSVASYDDWRRTSDGWEKNTNWKLRGKPKAARIHPTLLAGFQVLACVGSLVASTPSSQTEDKC